MTKYEKVVKISYYLFLFFRILNNNVFLVADKIHWNPHPCFPKISPFLWTWSYKCHQHTKRKIHHHQFVLTPNSKIGVKRVKYILPTVNCCQTLFPFCVSVFCYYVTVKLYLDVFISNIYKIWNSVYIIAHFQSFWPVTRHWVI